MFFFFHLQGRIVLEGTARFYQELIEAPVFKISSQSYCTTWKGFKKYSISIKKVFKKYSKSIQKVFKKYLKSIQSIQSLFAKVLHNLRSVSCAWMKCLHFNFPELKWPILICYIKLKCFISILTFSFAGYMELAGPWQNFVLDIT